MPRKRSTIEIDTIKMRVNWQLRNTSSSVDARRAIAGILESILFEANAYRGFRDVYWSEEGGYEAWIADDCPDFPEKYQYIYGTSDGSDTYRRRYY